MKKIITLFFLLLFSLVIFSPILYSQDEQKDRRFDDPAGRYTIDLPSGWQIEEKDGETIFFASKEEEACACCFVFGFPVEDGVTLEDMANWMTEGFQDREEEYTFAVTGTKKTKIAGVDALWMRQEETYKTKDFPKTIVIDEYFLIAGGQGITLHFETLKDSYKVFQNDFSRMAASFYIGERPFDEVIKDEAPSSPGQEDKDEKAD